ncbi:MAG TPA: hypothetical protein DCP55_03600 [Chitinophagaceae bacterium]|nr:hypothetical protein [Chitinophagaceae bacterium]
MASLKKAYIKIFLGVSVLGMANTFASGFEKAGDINVTATGGSKAIGRADHVTTDHLTQNQGGRGGDNHFQFTVGGTSPHAERERRPHEYFSEGEEFLRMIPPNYSRAAESFLKASGASEQDMKIEAYLKYAECMSIDNPSKASTYFEKVLELQPSRDEAFRGLMKLDYDSSRDAADDPEYLKEILISASTHGSQIKRKNKEDRGLLKEITAKLSELSLEGELLRPVHLSSSAKKEGDSSHIDDEDISTPINPKVETGKQHIIAEGEAKALGVYLKSGSNSNVTTGDLDIQAKDRARAAGVVVGDIDF